MTDTANNPNVLTTDYIRDMVRNGDRPTTQQSWVWRSLLYCFREMQRDIKQYRSDMGRVDNRNSPAYWCDWMSDGRLQRGCAASDIHNIILEDAKDPPRNLSGSHMDKAVQFLTSEGVAENVLKFVQR
mgnify:CR=1 FL=1